MGVVTRRRRLRILLALVLLLGTRVVYAVPAQATAELTAVSHCTQHTGRPSSVPKSRHCCNVTSDADTPATIAASLAVPASHLVSLPGTGPTVPALSPCDAPRSTAASTRDGPPRYLALRTIRR
jgi:hypothetical protein